MPGMSCPAFQRSRVTSQTVDSLVSNMSHSMLLQSVCVHTVFCTLNERFYAHFNVLHSVHFCTSTQCAYPGILFGGGSRNSVEGRENGNLGAVGL